MMKYNTATPDQTRDRIYYEEGAAPFGELNLVRADWTQDEDINRQHQGVAPISQNAVPYIAQEAWFYSSWLAEELNHDSTALSDMYTVPPTSQPFGLALQSAVYWGAQQPQKRPTWLAVVPPTEQESIKGLGDTADFDQFVGFSNGKVDISGNFLERAVKRVKYPEKVYAAISNVNVSPEYQSDGLGVALFDATLGTHQPERRATTYVDQHNTRLIAKLGSLGFEQTDDDPAPRDDLIRGATTFEYRFQAESVALVRGLLKEQYDWLK